MDIKIAVSVNGADLENNMCPLLPLSHTLQRANKGSKVIERLKKKLSEQESLLLLMSPNMAFRVHNRNGKVRAALSPSGPALGAWLGLHMLLLHREVLGLLLCVLKALCKQQTPHPCCAKGYGGVLSGCD